VLVEGASMPESADLPESLRPLLRRHAIRVSHSTFESDLGALVRALRIIDRATHGHRAPRQHADADAETKPLVVTPAPEPALPAPPPTPNPIPTAPVTPPSAPAPPPPVTTPAYVQPPPPAYAPPVTPVYPYAQPAYGYVPPAKRSGPSGLVIGVVALLVVLVVGVGLMFALQIGPFAVAQASPTPPPTVFVPTMPPETPTPVPPTATVPPTESAPLTAPPTASVPPVTSTPGGPFDALWAVVPDTVRESCSEDDSLGTVRLYCFIATQGFSIWYERFDDLTALTDEYDSWLDFRSIDPGTANCFDDPMPLPCEGQYTVGGIDPAGNVAGITDGANGWLYWTHEQALVFGTGLTTLDETHSYDDMFGYWASDASVLNFTPAPTP
jgi:hypothetical protein